MQSEAEAIAALKDINGVLKTHQARDSAAYDAVATSASPQDTAFKRHGITVNDAGLGVTGADALAACLSPFADTLSSLSISNNAMRTPGLIALLAPIASLSALSCLSITHEGFRDEGAEKLAAVIPTLRSLDTLVLSKNKIHISGAQALAAALPRCHRLEKLVLNNNPIGNEGIILVTEAVSRMDEMTSLGLSGTRMTDDGLRVLLTELSADDAACHIEVRRARACELAERTADDETVRRSTHATHVAHTAAATVPVSMGPCIHTRAGAGRCTGTR